uniref:COX assembly mitochondrial protein n=1 Tax=Arcella intermedia TaxID=1963864 RepID=A0A6B2LV21_9EUKA
MKHRALGKCQGEIDGYANCTKERTFTALWACRSLLHKMKDCTSYYANDEEVAKFKVAYASLQREREDGELV